MNIADIRIRRVSGTLATDGPFWEDRLLRPVDIYPEFAAEGPLGGVGEGRFEVIDDSHSRLHSYFVHVLSDDGVDGVFGPVDGSVAHIIGQQLRPLLLGRDPLATEFLWDLMHRMLVHGRQGEAMMAISAIDCALWDLKGRWLGQPVWRLLGGPTRTDVPAYASMLGFDAHDMGRVRERALAFQAQGFGAQKWFFRHGPMAGPEGMAKNVELVRTLREALGEGDAIMLDCWQSMDYAYVVELASRIEEYRPRWLEEVAMPDRIDTYRQIKDKITIPLSGAEHDYTRWGMQRFIEKGALDILQPDIYWAGGISEVMKIAALATTHDLITIPHGHSTQASIQFSATQSPIHTPWQEFLVKWNIVHQFFLTTTLIPEGGSLQVPDAPGLGIVIDEEQVEESVDVSL